MREIPQGGKHNLLDAATCEPGRQHMTEFVHDHHQQPTGHQCRGDQTDLDDPPAGDSTWIGRLRIRDLVHASSPLASEASRRGALDVVPWNAPR